MTDMSNVIIQKINLYDLDLQGNSSSDEEEENIAKNQQNQIQQPKKSPRSLPVESETEKTVECEEPTLEVTPQPDPKENAYSDITIKEEVLELDDEPVIHQTWQNLDEHTFIKQENELFVPTDNLDNENIMEDEIEASKDPEFPVPDEFGILDDQFGFFIKGTDDVDENPPKRIKIDTNTIVKTLPKGITVKRTSGRQVACKSTRSSTNGNITKIIGETTIKFNGNLSAGHEQVEENESERILTNSELAKSFTKNVGIVNKFGEISNKIVDRIINKRGDPGTPKVTQTSQKSATKSPTTSKVTQNSSQRPSTSFFMPTQFQDIPIKEEPVYDEPVSHQEPKIKEEPSDEYFTPAYSQQPLNSTVTSTSDTIVSTKVVTLPASNMLKSRKIIVIKKPATPGTKPVSGQSIQRALSSQIRATSRTEPEDTKYIIRTVNLPNRPIKIKDTTKSSLQISSISGAATSSNSTFKTIVYPKSNSTGQKVVLNHTDLIYRCQKCHLLFSSHIEYTDHLKEHRIPQGIVFNEKRVIKLEELRKMNAFQCAQCSAGFPTMEKLSAHENRHKSEFSCKHCGKTFLQMFRYKEHMATHEKIKIKKEKYISCEQCDKKFLKQIKLDEHVMNAHAERDSYLCTPCDIKFPTVSALQEHHNLIHKKKTVMKCGLCSYETPVKQNFEKHASMHMRYVEKLNSKQFFKCDQCPQSFREVGVLEMHKQHMHS